MKKVCVVGHFGFGENMLNGQTIKTKTVTTELERQLGADQVMKIDTHGGAKVLPRVIIQLINAFKNCKNVIIFPAHNGVRVFVPLCSVLNKLFHRKLHYVVIGGWLPSFLKGKDRLSEQLKKFDGIYVETTTMQTQLEKQSFENIRILRNFKNVLIVGEKVKQQKDVAPFSICTFSRVMKEKGIEEIVNAVKQINMDAKQMVYKLDIYGQVDQEQVEWFNRLQRDFPSCVKYKGLVPFDKSVDVLKNYFFLVFPTRFYTEGVPGTIIDAYAAGLPVLSSMWESFNDVIEDGITGIGYKFDDYDELIDVLSNIAKQPEIINEKRENCIRKAYEYAPQNAIGILIDNL